jgi:hypothetical protein
MRRPSPRDLTHHQTSQQGNMLTRLLTLAFVVLDLKLAIIALKIRGRITQLALLLRRVMHYPVYTDVRETSQGYDMFHVAYPSQCECSHCSRCESGPQRQTCCGPADVLSML